MGVTQFLEPGRRSGGGAEMNGVAEVFELIDEVASSSFGVVAVGEVVDADLGVDGGWHKGATESFFAGVQ